MFAEHCWAEKATNKSSHVVCKACHRRRRTAEQCDHFFAAMSIHTVTSTMSAEYKASGKTSQTALIAGPSADGGGHWPWWLSCNCKECMHQLLGRRHDVMQRGMGDGNGRLPVCSRPWSVPAGDCSDFFVSLLLSADLL